MPKPDHSGRMPCILFLSCFGASLKYFLQLSKDFRKRYYIVPYLQANINILPDLLPEIEAELAKQDGVLLYHEPDCMYLGEHRERYDQFIAAIPGNVAKVPVPQPRFYAFWPFHCGEPRNADPDRPLNGWGKLPCYWYGDSYILRLLREGIPPDEIIARYIAADLSDEVDLDRGLRATRRELERQDQTGPVKLADFVFENFRAAPLFTTTNHPSDWLLLYISNEILKLLDCETVPFSVLDSIAEIAGDVRREMPVHPSIGRHFGAAYINESTRYVIDEIRQQTFAEFIRDYVYYRHGILNYADGLLNDPTARPAQPTAGRPSGPNFLHGTDCFGARPGSPESVAYRLLQHIAAVERRNLNGTEPPIGTSPADREWMLRTYSQCLACFKDAEPQPVGRSRYPEGLSRMIDVQAELSTVIRDVFVAPEIEIRRETVALDVPGWDSIGHARLLLTIEMTFSIAFDPVEAATVKDVGQLSDLIERKLRE